MIVNNLFTEAQLEQLLSLPEVVSSRNILNTQKTVYFSAAIPDSIRQILQDQLGVDLSGVSQVPFRWIRGDTVEHKDQGTHSFEKTHLVYLTDGEGRFHIGVDAYPIEAGTGFIFSEGMSHSVVDTNNTSRLLLGPMSETGMAVGIVTTNINADGATDTVYIKMINSAMNYKINNGSWNVITFWPVNIQNTNSQTTNNILKVLFQSNIDLTRTNHYFYCASDGIQFGDTSLNSNGTKTIFTVINVENYPGLIDCRNRSNIYVYNLHVTSAIGSTVIGDGGWIGQYAFGKDGENNFIMNCSSDGPINEYSGGIVGSEAGSVSESGSADLTITGCWSSGSIGLGAGGIAGQYAAYNGGRLTVVKCSSSGIIGVNAGGIVGTYSGVTNGAVVQVQKSYSLGLIGENAGGIFGSTCGSDGGSASGISCYSRGDIGMKSGGIFGIYAGIEGGSASVENSYSTGSITSDTSGGIIGYLYGNVTCLNCYTTGETALAKGYIFSDSTSVGATNYSEAKNGTSGWKNTNADSVLLLTGVYTKVGTNEPYLLLEIGPSPYSLVTINGEDLTTQVSKSAIAGVPTSSGFSQKDSYSLINPPIGVTINASTGAVTVSDPGVYTLLVLSTFLGTYNTTYLVLTVTPRPPVQPVNKKQVVLDSSSYTALRRQLVNNSSTIGISPVKFRAPLFYSFYKASYKLNVKYTQL